MTVQTVAIDTASSSAAAGRALAAALATRPTGVIADSFPGRITAIGGQGILTSGRQNFAHVWLEAGQVVTNIAFYSGGTAAGTPTAQWFSLYDGALAKLGVTADDTNVAWAGNARKSLAMSSPYTVLTTGLYYAGIMVAAATPPTLLAAANNSVILGRPPIASGQDATNTGLTTPASAPVTAAALTVASHMPYCEIT